MTRRSSRALWAVLGGCAAVGLIAWVAAGLNLHGGLKLQGHPDAGGGLLAFARTQSQAKPPSLGTLEDPAPIRLGKALVDSLPCFDCHNIGRFRAGDSFPHEKHQEQGLGHCHVCHAFSGHFMATVRREICEECH